ncbi:MAG TPA: cytochrome d ubiquinol oxidase subunit II [Candidatus Limnocylindria bacterium]|jgi:cytochrome d ubiquinol oxidase subunit II|nr:cytochrome d ubiquinol oxidase subunit II [Candidatus Limnocylindria bacterium]
MLELTVAAFTLFSLILYALTGGADFGGGMWDLLASGPRAARQREVIASAIGPIWEANHVWLILIVVLLFTGFPAGFAAMMTALHIPLTVMLVGIVLRGSAFIFRKYDSRSAPVQRRWSTLFGAASFFTPFVQGIVLGALVTGRIRVLEGRVLTGFFAGWLTPFALLCGLFALALFAFLSATYLSLECPEEPELQNDFRKRALGSGLALAPITLCVFLSARTGAPAMFDGLTHWWAPLLLLATSVFALAALGALWFRKYTLARVAAIGQVALILFGWCLAQYPNLIIPDVTTLTCAAPPATLRLLILALAGGSLALFPSLFFLFYVFKRER